MKEKSLMSLGMSRGVVSATCPRHAMEVLWGLSWHNAASQEASPALLEDHHWLCSLP